MSEDQKECKHEEGYYGNSSFTHCIKNCGYHKIIENKAPKVEMNISKDQKEQGYTMHPDAIKKYSRKGWQERFESKYISGELGIDTEIDMHDVPLKALKQFISKEIEDAKKEGQEENKRYYGLGQLELEMIKKEERSRIVEELNEKLEPIRVGKRIKEIRKEYGITLKEMGKLIGVSESMMSHVEAGNKILPRKRLKKLKGLFINQLTRE